MDCIFAGRQVTRLSIQIKDSGSAVAKVSKGTDEKTGYKNWISEDLIRYGDLLLISGHRIEVQSVSDSTFDWSGILVYDFAGKANRWVVAGLSKDDLYKKLGANKYKMQVVGDQLLIYAVSIGHYLTAKLTHKPLLVSNSSINLSNLDFTVVDSNSSTKVIAGIELAGHSSKPETVVDNPTQNKPLLKTWMIITVAVLLLIGACLYYRRLIPRPWKTSTSEDYSKASFHTSSFSDHEDRNRIKAD